MDKIERVSAALRIDDRDYLLGDQYKTPRNLDARAALHKRFSTNCEGWSPWVLRHIDLAETADILDIGCGTGALWKTNRDRIPGGWRIMMADFSEGMLERAKEELAAEGRRFDFVIADIQDLPFADRSFDGVVANHMLYHVPDLGRALAECHRVLKPGGSFYASTNGALNMYELWELVHTFIGDGWANPHSLLSFRVDNGASFLERYFTEVRFFGFEDHLRVTAVDALIDYFLSSETLSRPVRLRKEDFRRYLEARILRDGSIEIRKDVGIFAARRAWRA